MTASDVALRPVTAGDAPFLWTWFHGTPDPEWKRWDAPYFHAAADAAPSREEFLAEQRDRSGNPHHRVITADGLDVGLVTRYEERPAGGGWWELGVLVFDPAHWGRGVGGRAPVGLRAPGPDPLRAHGPRRPAVSRRTSARQSPKA